MNVLEALSAISSVATAVGVGVAAYQLFFVRRQSMTSFEDSLNAQYRIAIEQIPIEALFGEALNTHDPEHLLVHFYRYFDLCNEQAFLHSNGRISAKTWHNWKSGIESNLARPAFADVWAVVACRSKGDFSSLRVLCPPKRTGRNGVT